MVSPGCETMVQHIVSYWLGALIARDWLSLTTQTRSALARGHEEGRADGHHRLASDRGGQDGQPNDPYSTEAVLLVLSTASHPKVWCNN